MYKLLMVLLFYLFSVLLPTYLIHVYSKYEGWTTKQLINRERRMVPYVISILCYFLGFYLLTLMNTPDFISVIFVVAIIIQVLCAAVNQVVENFHPQCGIGGVTGMVVALLVHPQFRPHVVAVPPAAHRRTRGDGAYGAPSAFAGPDRVRIPRRPRLRIHHCDGNLD